MKAKIIKIVSIVLVLCTLLTAFVIPASALSLNGQLDNYFSWSRFGYKSNSNNETYGYSVSDLNYFRQSYGTYLVSYKNLLLSKGFSTFTLQSNQVNIDLNEGDIFSFNISVLAPPCDLMALHVWDTTGRRIGIYPFIRSTSKEFTTIAEIKNYSGDTLSYGDGRVFCHRYTLSAQIVAELTSLHGVDIGMIQIQAFSSPANQTRQFWIYGEESYFTVTEKEEESGKDLFSIIGSIWQKIKDFFSAFSTFMLDFGSKIKEGVRDYFVSLPGNIKTSLSSLFEGLRNVFSSVGDTLKSFTGGLMHEY